MWMLAHVASANGKVMDNVIIDGSDSQYWAFKLTYDSASSRGSKDHWTTVMLQALCSGVKEKVFSTQAVVNILQGALSPSSSLKAKVWKGPDNGPHFKAHVYELLKELIELEDSGLEGAVVQRFPPRLVFYPEDLEQSAEGAGETLQHRKRDGSSFNDGHGKRSSREFPHGRPIVKVLPHGRRELVHTREGLIQETIFFPRVVVGLDGGAFISGAGQNAALNGDKPDLLSNTRKQHMQQPFEWVPLEDSDNLTDSTRSRFAEHTNSAAELDMWVQMAIMGNNSELQAEFAHSTRKLPTRVVLQTAAPSDEDCMFEDNATTAQLDANAARAAAGSGAAERAEEYIDDVPPGFAHLTYQSPVDTRNPAAAVAPVVGRTWVRMPVVPTELGERTDLTDAAWGDLPLLVRACLCILHDSMRCSESTFSLLMKDVISAFGAGRRVLSTRLPAPPPPPPRAAHPFRTARPLIPNPNGV
jgi:hypothetical protein